MVTKLLNYRPLQLFLTILIILGAAICVFTPNYLLFKIGASFANQIMLLYLGMGLLFLILKQPKLTFTSFACCGILCMFLKLYSNWEWPIPVNPDQQVEVVMEVAHFNVTASNDDYQSTIDAIIASNADVVSLQEVTPDWQPYLKEFLKEAYPYSTSMVRFDPYGLAIYSKSKILSVDTFYFEIIPNLHVSVESRKKDLPVSIVSSYTKPPLSQSSVIQLQEHMRVIATYVQKISEPVITLGEYHAPPWFEEVRMLMQTGQLLDSRSRANQGLDNLFQYPIDYIFYSEQLRCSDFHIVEGPSTSNLGIQAAFEFNLDYKNAQAAVQ